MQFGEAVRLALQSLWSNKMRSISRCWGGDRDCIGDHGGDADQRAKQYVTSKINSYGAAVVTISKMPQSFMTLASISIFKSART